MTRLDNSQLEHRTEIGLLTVSKQDATGPVDSSVNHAVPDFLVMSYIGTSRNGPLLIRPENAENLQIYTISGQAISPLGPHIAHPFQSG